MKPFFTTGKVDRRSEKSMIEFLESHSTYGDRRSAGFSLNVKVHRLGLSKELEDRAWDIACSGTEFHHEIDHVIDDFTRQYNGDYTIGFNGRSSGYLVLYHSYYKTIEHHSHCVHCGQRNFMKVPPKFTDPAEAAIAGEVLKSQFSWRAETYLGQSAIQALDIPDDAKLTLIRRFLTELRGCSATAACGVCGKERVNYTVRPRYLETRGGVNASDVYELSKNSLKARVDLVCEFHKAADMLRLAFIDMLDEYEVTEKTIMVPKTIRVLSPRSTVTA